jgi:hypothetical protein
MTGKFGNQGIYVTRLKGPARDFAIFCTVEKERRENSSDEFDVQVYKEAVNLVLRLLLQSDRGKPG